MNKDNLRPFTYRDFAEDHPAQPAWTDGTSPSRPSIASILSTNRLSRVDALHVIPALNSVLPVRVYAAAPLTHLPYSLFPYLFTTAQVRTVPAGTVVVVPEANCREYLAVLEGELEVQQEIFMANGVDEIQIGRLMKSASAQAIILLHTIPCRSCVRAVTAARVLQFDSTRVEALLAWMLRCDARRNPVKLRQ